MDAKTKRASSRRRPWWRVTAAGVLLLGVFGSAPIARGQAPAPETAGETKLTVGGDIEGEANAKVLGAIPFVGDFRLPARFGTTGARLRGKEVRASAGVVNLGLLGTLTKLALSRTPTLDKLGIDSSPLTKGFQIPEPIDADAREEPRLEASPVLPRADVGAAGIGGGHEVAEAPPSGPAHARVEMGDVALNLGLVVIHASGGVSETSVSQTETVATVSFGELAIRASGSLITLRGIEWRVSQRLGQPANASFSIGSATVGPTRLPVPVALPAQGVLDVINRTLAPTGLTLSMPDVNQGPSGGAVGPLRIMVKDSPGAATFGRPLYEATLGDLVKQLEQQAVSGVPETGLGITVANVLLSAATGKGGVAIELGGVDGQIGKTPVESFDFGGLPIDAVLPFDAGAPPINGAIALPPVTGAEPVPARAEPLPAALGPTPMPAGALPLARAAATERLGPGPLIAAFGAAALLVLRSRDRRRIRSILDA